MNVKEWETKKKQIEKAKEQVSRNRGKKESILSRLEKEYGCSSIQEASAKMEELKKKLEKTEEQLERMVEELQQYDWDI
jgi:chromosome segregation ATPase